MAMWAQLSVGNASLIELFDGAQIQCLLQGTVLRGKQKADRLEAIIVTLHQLLAENDRWGASKTRLAEDTLDSIMDALLAIGQLKRDADSFVKHVNAGASADEIRLWLRTFQSDWGDVYTHSSPFGRKDWTTNTGRLTFPDTEEVRRQLESKLVTMYHPERPLCYVEMATPSYPFFEDIDSN